jgi:hypothetical protein
MKKTVIFLIVLSLTIALLTASPTPARAHHWGFFWPGFAAGVGAGVILNPFFYPRGYYYPAPAPYYYYPPAPYPYYGGYYNYRPRNGYYGHYNGEYRGEGNNGRDEYQGEEYTGGGYQGGNPGGEYRR